MNEYSKRRMNPHRCSESGSSVSHLCVVVIASSAVLAAPYLLAVAGAAENGIKRQTAVASPAAKPATKSTATAKQPATKTAAPTTSSAASTAGQQSAAAEKPTAPKTESVAVSGVVLDPDGKAVPGARVIIYPFRGIGDISAEVQTGEDGKFAAKIDVELLPAAVLAQLPKNMPRPYARAIIVAPNYAIAGGALSLMEATFRLTRGVVARGVVNDAEGKPVGGTKVRLRGIYTQDHSGSGTIWVGEKHQDLFSVESGADGQWKMDALPLTGTAMFELADDKFALTSAQQELQDSDITVSPLVARPGVKVSGRAVYEGGKPAAGITVSANSVGRDGGYASAKTAADGTYTLSRLSASAINITATDTSNEWVVPSIENLSTQGGTTIVAPDLVLQRGMQLEGTILDADTKAPLEGAVIAAQGSHGFTQSTPSDKQGRYRVRVLPGSYYVYLFSTPVGYIRSDTNNNMTFALGQKTIAPMLLKKGLTLTGTAVDEEGRPASGATIRAGRWDGIEAIVDEKGNWTLLGVRSGSQNRGEPEGVVVLSTSGEWHIVSPEQLKVPVTGPVKVTLRRIKLAGFTGRVRTPQGDPVPAANVRVKLFLDKERNSYRTLERSTDDQGLFTMSQLRPEQSVVLTVSKTGYKYASGGEVTQKDDVFSATDIVLTPLRAVLAGRVLDANGKPVAGARVASPDGSDDISSVVSAAVSDAQGRFTLRNLPDDAAHTIAAHAYSVGSVKDKPGSDLAITLVEKRAPRPEDAQRAVAIIEQWKGSTDEKQRSAAQQAALALGALDPERALALVAKEDGTVENGLRWVILQAAMRRDPRRAVEWGPAQLELITDKNVQVLAAAELGLAVAEVKPELATELLRRAKAIIKPNDFSAEAANSYIRFAALAGKLKLPEAANFTDMALIAAERSVNKRHYGSTLGSFAATVAPGGMSLVERVLSDLPPDGRLQALQRAISEVAPTDAKLAATLLVRLEELVKTPRESTVVVPPDNEYRPSPEQLLETATMSVVRALARQDAPAALVLARRVKNNSGQRALGMAMAAQGHDATTAAPIFREAMQAVQAGEWNSGQTMARIAAMAALKDIGLGEELFKQAREQVSKPSPYSDDDSRESYAAYAFYHAPLDPAESRLLIETEWARRSAPVVGVKPNDGSDYMRTQRLMQLATAMVAVDPDRALEMLKSPLGSTDSDWQRQSALRRIVKYVMSPETTQRTMAIDGYGDEDD